jgi:hypothetical protein
VMVEPSGSRDTPSNRVEEANEIPRAAQEMPRGAERIQALIKAGVLRNRAVLTDLDERHVR